MFGGPFQEGVLAVFRTIARPRVLASLVLTGLAGTAAINAVFGQDSSHPATIFAMRDDGSSHRLRADEAGAPTGNVTRIVFEGQQTPSSQNDGAAPRTLPEPVVAARPSSNETLEDAIASGPVVELQTLLSQLGFYEGEIDGQSGPMTQRAIEDYKLSAGLQGIELSTDQLVISARNNLLVTAAIPEARPEAEQIGQVETVVFTRPEPVPTPRPEQVEPAPQQQSGITDAMTVMQVQSALHEFSGDTLVVDGIYGANTRKVIEDFQSAFRMEVTGTIDATLIERLIALGMLDG